MVESSSFANSVKNSPYKLPARSDRDSRSRGSTASIATRRMSQSRSAGNLTRTRPATTYSSVNMLPMQRARQGKSFPRTKRFSSPVTDKPRARTVPTPGPAHYEVNVDSVKYRAATQNLSSRYNGGSQTVSGVGFMGKANRPGDITPGPGAYESTPAFDKRANIMGHEDRFKKDPVTPGPACYKKPAVFGKVGSGGTLSSSMSSGTIGLKSQGKSHILQTPGPAAYSPYEPDSFARFAPKTLILPHRKERDPQYPGPGHYEQDREFNSSKAATMKFRRPVAKLYSKSGGGWLGHEMVPDANTPGPTRYKTMHTALSNNFKPTDNKGAVITEGN